MARATNKSHHSGTVKRSIVINIPAEKVWRKVSNIVGLDWVVDVKRTIFLSKIKRGVGAVRKLTFRDGHVVEEHVVAWKNGQYFTYIAVSGLPLRGYCATISILPKNKRSAKVSWQSYFNTEKMTAKEFSEFVSFMGTFYQSSLKNLKSKLE